MKSDIYALFFYSLALAIGINFYRVFINPAPGQLTGDTLLEQINIFGLRLILYMIGFLVIGIVMLFIKSTVALAKGLLWSSFVLFVLIAVSLIISS
jgi:hypothetical protein